MSELKPCPNPECQHKGLDIVHRGAYTKVQCMCGVSGPLKLTYEQARAAWNATMDNEEPFT